MSEKQSRFKKPLFIFYILVVYVFLQFIWWGNLLIEQYALNEALGATRKVYMILGEGLVFLLILLFGVWQVKKSFLREVYVSVQQKNFLLSITHEFNTPIASVKLILQTMKKRKMPDEKKEQLLDTAENEINRLAQLAQNILTATKIEGHRYDLFIERVELSSFIEQSLRSIKFKSKQSFHYSFENIEASTDKSALLSIVTNLVENAAKYSPKESTITVKLYKNEEQFTLEVIDEGIGISTEEKKHIFKKFYRVGSEETRKTKGTGLGLYLVKFFVKQLNGTISVEDHIPNGTVFKMDFPLHLTPSSIE